MKSSLSTHRVNLGQLSPVVDANGAHPTDPDERPPQCPRCLSAAFTVWCVSRLTKMPVLIGLSCTPQQTGHGPKADTRPALTRN